MARKPTSLDNTDVKNFLAETQILNYFELPRWLDDCFSGAAGQVAGTQKFSPAQLFNIVRSLDEITTESVLRFLNRKRDVVGDVQISERYAQYVAKAARVASQAIKYHRLYNKVDNTEIEDVKPLPYSPEEMRVIKYLSLNSPHSELVAYEKLLKEQYGI